MVFLGIDCGSTLVKASLIDENGAMLASVDCRPEVLSPRPGWVERDMSALWMSVSALIRELAPSEVRAVGCTGHGNGLYALSKSRQPLGNAILSMDSRARDLLKTAEGLYSRISAMTLQKLYPAQTAVLLRWLKQHQSDVYGQVGTVLLCKDYLNFCLTGEIATDYTDMSATSLMDVKQRTYSAELLQELGLDDIMPKLPPVYSSTAVIGTVTMEAAQLTGLRQGIPVIAGMIDIAASAIGAGVTQPGQACIIAGTWSINEVIVDQPHYHPDLFLTSVFADPTQWLMVEASATSTTNLEWLLDFMFTEEKRQAAASGVSVYQICENLLAQAPVETQDVIFHPFVFDSNAHPTARAGFYGLTGWHSRAHALRAVYEGIAFGHRYHLERLQRAGAVITSARLTGGVARSLLWSQMFADVLNLPLEVPDREETGSAGVALAAGIGHSANLGAIATPVKQTFMPDSAQKPFYERRYQLYTHLLEVLPSVWDAFEK